MSKVLLFILVPLTFVSFISAGGMFESEGGIEKLRAKKDWFSRIFFYPLTYEHPEDWSHDISRILTIPMVAVFYLMSCVGYTQYLCTSISSKVSSTIFAIMFSACVYVVVAA
ncbi:hypothetical protein NO559_13515 [Dasania sp. GY-MA-18]|uniref:Uncharacterized protein n=1 Tax=Dasania phycosphaerae TaxID=2950436 RepID=A0A9J6RNZ1_9GAMM|nr:MULTISPECIES: hypothetical protein [Dasania]MCR8923794.1 hypothetical protein [Dasania sp. GY-MA-18]MCZ0866228.1 hypothetical protein [Dasania phycosphaerae]MCZ0869952.1 hypothetical protein [Dasania phycosphaerae]